MKVFWKIKILWLSRRTRGKTRNEAKKTALTLKTSKKRPFQEEFSAKTDKQEYITKESVNVDNFADSVTFTYRANIETHIKVGDLYENILCRWGLNNILWTHATHTIHAKISTHVIFFGSTPARKQHLWNILCFI